jgi:hypothetical protein
VVLRTCVLCVARAAARGTRAGLREGLRAAPRASPAQCSNRFAVLDGVNFICKVSSKGQCMYAFVKLLKTMAATLRQLLDNRNSWSQSIKLELFENKKSIFGDSFHLEAPRKKEFHVISGATTPVPLYEFELRDLFVEATTKSGCRWWCRRSVPSNASVRVRQTLWSVDMLCRHHEKEYDKKAVDDTRASRCLVRCSCPAICKLRAVQVQIGG